MRPASHSHRRFPSGCAQSECGRPCPAPLVDSSTTVSASHYVGSRLPHDRPLSTSTKNIPDCSGVGSRDAGASSSDSCDTASTSSGAPAPAAADSPLQLVRGLSREAPVACCGQPPSVWAPPRAAPVGCCCQPQSVWALPHAAPVVSVRPRRSASYHIRVAAPFSCQRCRKNGEGDSIHARELRVSAHSSGSFGRRRLHHLRLHGRFSHCCNFQLHYFHLLTETTTNLRVSSRTDSGIPIGSTIGRRFLSFRYSNSSSVSRSFFFDSTLFLFSCTATMHVSCSTCLTFLQVAPHYFFRIVHISPICARFLPVARFSELHHILVGRSLGLLPPGVLACYLAT